MTENEAIRELHNIRPRGSIIPQKRAEALDVAIQALEEIQQYRAIGTIEEFKALKEKSEPMKLAKEKGFCIGKDKDGGEIYEIKECCPSCGLYGMESLLRYDWDGCYCPKCGQKLDWN